MSTRILCLSLTLACLLVVSVDLVPAETRLHSLPPGAISMHGEPGVNPLDLLGAWVLLESKSGSEAGASGSKRILILRKQIPSPYGGQSTFTIDSGPWPPGSHEHWLKDATGIYLLSYGPFRRTPLNKTGREDLLNKDWKIHLGEEQYIGRVATSGDTLVLEPVQAPASKRTFVRYREYQVPTWTQTPPVVPRVEYIPAAGSRGERDTLHIVPEPVVQAVPAYPSFAREAGITGKVHVLALVNKDGLVANTKLKQSVTGLSDAAMNAARQWTFKPGMKNGQPTPAWVTLVFSFSLQ